MVNLVGAAGRVRGQLQLDDQLSVVLLGAGEYWNDSRGHYRCGGNCADGFEYSGSSTGRDRQQHLYDWEARTDAHLHRDRPDLHQSALVRVGYAAGDRRVLAISFAAAVRVYWIRNGGDSRRRD